WSAPVYVSDTDAKAGAKSLKNMLTHKRSVAGQEHMQTLTDKEYSGLQTQAAEWRAPAGRGQRGGSGAAEAAIQRRGRDRHRRAAGGIGRATAEALAELGATTVLVGRTQAKLEEVKAALGKAGAKSEAFAADVSNEADVARLRDFVKQTWGRAKAV